MSSVRELGVKVFKFSNLLCCNLTAVIHFLRNSPFVQFCNDEVNNNVWLFVSQNVTANHRASDAIVCEGRPQVLSGRFMYGPLDVVTLTGEKVTKVLILGLIYQDK